MPEVTRALRALANSRQLPGPRAPGPSRPELKGSGAASRLGAAEPGVFWLLRDYGPAGPGASVEQAAIA